MGDKSQPLRYASEHFPRSGKLPSTRSLSPEKLDHRVKEKRPQDWSAAERLTALQESHVLSGEPLNAWRRERGLLAHHLSGWKTAFCTEAKAVPGGRELRGLNDENEPLKRELLRKDKALSEAAALLILQKKFRALCEGEVK